MNTFLVLIIVIALSVGSTNASILFPKNKVYIVNSLSKYDDVLRVHCRSIKDDLGVHLVRYPLDNFHFELGDNIFGGTKFICTLSHGVGFKSSVTFTAYEEGGSFYIRFGALDVWEAREDGIYLTDDNHHATFMYAW
ncbi:hypothetical protein CARUB_v10015915mg [Capsella rubella]|uniref:S-protein homolog n=1 Tax=Capsella rubella TaxID=81985 RepID=R0I7Z7_9BRAS|nr:hypothetical protein CARUB_v10015915mg [Capsella rubella]